MNSSPSAASVCYSSWTRRSFAARATLFLSSGSPSSCPYNPMFANDNRRGDLLAYLTTLFEATDLSVTVGLAALVYLDRLSESGIEVTVNNAPRLAAAAVFLAHKFLDDECFRNSDWARVLNHTGCTKVFSTASVTRMESELLARLSFSLWVSPEELVTMASRLTPPSSSSSSSSSSTAINPSPSFMGLPITSHAVSMEAVSCSSQSERTAPPPAPPAPSCGYSDGGLTPPSSPALPLVPPLVVSSCSPMELDSC